MGEERIKRPLLECPLDGNLSLKFTARNISRTSAETHFKAGLALFVICAAGVFATGWLCRPIRRFFMMDMQIIPVSDTSNQPGQSLITFALVDSKTNKIVEGYEALTDAAPVNFSDLGLSEYSLAAVVNSDHPEAKSVQSIQFQSDFGDRIESVAPYALFGDTNGNYAGRVPKAGSYRIQATAFSKDGARGNAIAATNLDYTLETLTPMAPPPAAEVSEPVPTAALDDAFMSQFDYVISHFDGNNNDRDDIAALPVAAMLINGAGLQDRSTIFYNNNLGESNNTAMVRDMRRSAAFAEDLGIQTYDYQADSSAATDALAEQLNSGKTVLILEGGPMEATYRALAKTRPENRANVTMLSHGRWNEERDRASRSGVQEVHTWADISADFPEVTQIQMADQNDYDQDKSGFRSSLWNWLDDASNPVFVEGRDAMQRAKDAYNDASDAGMHFYALTGNDNGNPLDAEAFLAEYSPAFDTDTSPSAPAPSPQPVPMPAPPPMPSLLESFKVEAEQLTLAGYEIETAKKSGASGQQFISLQKATHGEGSASGIFSGPAGRYQVKVHYFDENDGQSTVAVDMAGQQRSFVLDKDLPSSWAQPKSLTHRITHEAVELQPGDRFSISAHGHQEEFARIDAVEFTPIDLQPVAPPQQVWLEAEDLSLTGYTVESSKKSGASGQQFISLQGAKTGPGSATGTFEGQTGRYQINLHYFDENDGQSVVALDIGGEQRSLVFDKDLPSSWAQSTALTSQVAYTSVDLQQGDRFTLTADAHQEEFARIDAIEFVLMETATDALTGNTAPQVLGEAAAALDGIETNDLILPESPLQDETSHTPPLFQPTAGIMSLNGEGALSPFTDGLAMNTDLSAIGVDPTLETALV